MAVPRWLESQGRHAETESIKEKIEQDVSRSTGRRLPVPTLSAAPVTERGRIVELFSPAYLLAQPWRYAACWWQLGIRKPMP